MILSLIFLLALTRAEIVERMRAPVITQADGFVRVFADCPEDMRREFQAPVARFAADVLETLYRGERMKSVAFDSPPIIVHVGDVRTNDVRVVARVETNDVRVVTRLYLKSPGAADLTRFRVELTKAFFRTLRGRELSDGEALAAFCRADPATRRREARVGIERFLAGDRREKGDVADEDWDEQNLELLRKVVEVGVATRRDVATFSSRLFFYPPFFCEPFRSGARSLSFREAIDEAAHDGRVRALARRKAVEVALYGGGRSVELGVAAQAFVAFLDALASDEADAEDAVAKLALAEGLLKKAWEKAK